MAKFRQVLKSRNFFLLWLGQIISQFGDRLNQLALIALIYARAPGSSLELAKILSFTIIPVFLIGPFASSYVDRWDHRRTMIFCDLARALLVAVIALACVRTAALWPIYIIVFLTFAISRFFVPAKMAFIPELVSKGELLLANSLTSITGMIAAIIGFGIGGLVVERIGPQGGLLLGVVTYLVSGGFILAIRPLPLERPSPLPRQKAVLHPTLWADIQEGWRFFAGDLNVRFVARLFFLVWSAVGAIYVVAIVFVQNTLGSVTKDLGILAMCIGAGLFAGSLVYGRFGGRFSKAKAIFLALGLSGLTIEAFAVALKTLAALAAAASLSFVLGLTLSPIVISSNTLVHEVTNEKLRGRIFGFLEIVAHAGFLLFMLVSAFLAEHIGRFLVLLSVGTLLALVGFFALLRLDETKRLT